MSKCNKAKANSIFKTENPRLIFFSSLFMIHSRISCLTDIMGRSHIIDNYIFIVNRNKIKKECFYTQKCSMEENYVNIPYVFFVLVPVQRAN